ncbi:unnamed protein product [Rotaria sp. Silwood2]|nr:unnamed protein product [Rotaria sp. Silwood2]CAF4376345.1 unnamed protein product [Rotaria sp. Silwood2]
MLLLIFFYGIEIFLIFNRKLSDNENRIEFHNSVQELLKKLKALSISGINQLKLTNEEKQLAETLTCQYYGDIQLEFKPTSFTDAIELLKNLPNLLGKNNKNTKLKKVLLYPLYLLDDFISAKKRFHVINDHILNKSVEHMTSLHKVVISLNDIKINLSHLKIFYQTEQKRPSDTHIKINHWFDHKNVTLIRKQIALFINFSEINVNKNNIVFVVDEEDINKLQGERGVTTILYQNGVPMNFEIPSKPGCLYTTDNSCHNTMLSWRKPVQGSENIQQYMIYGQNRRNYQWKLLLTTVNDIPSATISNLEQGRYRFKIQGITVAGYTEGSDVCDTIDIVDRLCTEYFLSNEPLPSAEKNYYEQCKEYCKLKKQPLISIPDEIFDSTTELQSSSIKLGIDEDCQTFDLRDFLKKFCDILNIEVNDISIKKRQAGSAILEVTIYGKFKSTDKKLSVKMIYDMLTDKKLELLNQMKIFFLYMGPIESLREILKCREDIKLYPKYNRIYASGNFYWTGALNDGLDRGNQLYYCPIGWQRRSFYVTDNFCERFKGWCICCHGTKFKHGLSILLSGLKPAETKAHGDGIYATPSTNYACHPRYSEVKRIESSSRKLFFKSGNYVQFVVECRVHPKYIRKIGKETLGAEKPIIDSNIPNDSIEWVIDYQNKSIVDFNDSSASIVCSGLMIRVTDDHPGLLPQSQSWYESHICNYPKCCALGIDLEHL